MFYEDMGNDGRDRGSYSSSRYIFVELIVDREIRAGKTKSYKYETHRKVCFFFDNIRSFWDGNFRK